MIEGSHHDIEELKKCASCLGVNIINGCICNLSCGHYFHQDCLSHHFEKDPTILKCPCCIHEDKTTLIFKCKKIEHKRDRSFYIIESRTTTIFISPYHSLYDLINITASIMSISPHKLSLSINDNLFLNLRNTRLLDNYIDSLHLLRPAIRLGGDCLHRSLVCNSIGGQFNNLFYMYYI